MLGEETAGAETQGHKNPDLFTVGGNVTGVATMANSRDAPQKGKNSMYVCMIQQFPLLGVHPKEMKTGYQREARTPVLTAALFRVAKIQKQSKCPSTEEWIEKLPYTHTHTHTLAMRRRKSCLLQQYE